jgi:hypothetical protein
MLTWNNIESIKTEDLQLIFNIFILAVVPSVLWIIRYPLRELIKWLFTILGMEMWIERFGKFEYVGTSHGYLKTEIANRITFLIYKNENWYYKYITVWKEDKTLNKSKVFKTPIYLKTKLMEKYRLAQWWVLSDID